MTPDPQNEVESALLKTGPASAAGTASPYSIKVGTDAIGLALKAYFDGLVSEPVPDRFMELLSRLEDK